VPSLAAELDWSLEPDVPEAPLVPEDPVPDEEELGVLLEEELGLLEDDELMPLEPLPVVELPFVPALVPVPEVSFADVPVFEELS